ncbi:MAG TPA: hypothetical protein PKK26_20010, partial [Candidatus Wallbacteria bacterium]|nr:hypothetical protein [Candidatus Wallbacteria bacterium]
SCFSALTGGLNPTAAFIKYTVFKVSRVHIKSIQKRISSDIFYMNNNKIFVIGRLMFLNLMLMTSMTMLFAEGCTGSRNSAVSLVEEEPVVKEATQFRYSSSKQPNLNLKPIFDENCANCHNSEMETKLPLTNYLQVYTGGSVVRRSVQPGGSMQQYIPFEYSKIVEWIEAGMPQ